MEDYMSMMGMNAEMMRASAKPSALKQVQVELALTAVVKAEGIEISEEEHAAEVTLGILLLSGLFRLLFRTAALGLLLALTLH